MPCSNVFKTHVFKYRAFEILFGSHSFGPYFANSLHFFGSTFLNLILLVLYTSLTLPNLSLQNICPVILVVRRVLKQTSWQTYKNNVSGIKLSCRAIKEGLSGPNNYNQIF